MESAMMTRGAAVRRVGRLAPFARTAAEAIAATAMTMDLDRGRWFRRAAVAAGALLLLAGPRRFVAAAAITLVGVAALRRMRRRSAPSASVEAVVTIGRSVEEVATLWSNARALGASAFPFTSDDSPELVAELRPAPGGRGTELAVRVNDATRLAGGFTAAARLHLLRGLRRFKSLVETGEAPTINGQPAARADRQ